MAENNNSSFLVNVTIDGVLRTVSLDAPMVQAINSDDPMIRHQAYTIIAQQINSQTEHGVSPCQQSQLPSCDSESVIHTDPEDCGSCSSGTTPPPLQEEEESGRWGKEATLLLIAEYEDRVGKVNSGKKTKRVMWMEIASALETKGYKFSAEQVAGRWKSLIRGYKNCKDHNKKSGNDKKTYPFEERLDKIFANDPTIKPVYVSSSRSSPIQRADINEEETHEDNSLESQSDNDKMDGNITPGKGKKRKFSQGEEMLTVMKTFIENQNERKREEREQRERFHRERIDVIMSLVDAIKKQK